MKNITRHLGKLTVTGRNDAGYTGNPRYFVELDGWSCTTEKNASLGYSITNFDGKIVTANIGSHYGVATIENVKIATHEEIVAHMNEERRTEQKAIDAKKAKQEKQAIEQAKKQDYYSRQLQPLLIDTAKGGTVKVKFSGNVEATNWMNINLDSIESIQAFLEIIKEDLEKKELQQPL